MRILSVSEIQAVERAANEAGHSYAQMMALAGQGVARAILERRARRLGSQSNHWRVLVLVGPGNNGGDGLVAARYLVDAGAKVTAYLTRSREVADDPVFKRAVDRGVDIVELEKDEDCGALRRLVAGSHLVVDALLGTGATPPLRGGIARVLDAVQSALTSVRVGALVSLNGPQPPSSFCRREDRPWVVAVDGPSGMDFDTGEIAPEALRADLTITFANPKPGHFRFPAAECVGELVVADIGIPPSVLSCHPERSRRTCGLEVVSPRFVASRLPRRPGDAHKGTFGRALIVAGSSNYTGAAALAAAAAVRAGAGLVTLAIPDVIHAAIVPLVPEATALLLPNVMGALSRGAAPVLREHVEGYQAMLIGPGLSRTDETGRFLRAFLGIDAGRRRPGFVFEHENPETLSFPPLIVDADGLNILSEVSDWPEILPPATILTPHPGEMARLTGLETAEIQADRVGIARAYAEQWGYVVVLKGAFTVVAAPDGRVNLLPFANAGLASAGTGDVLAGTIVALRAQGLEAFEAAMAGAYLHGLAGEIVRVERGMAGMAAGDVAQALPEALRRLGCLESVPAADA
jgi:NAD(P)H-hydrate epimerase